MFKQNFGKCIRKVKWDAFGTFTLDSLFFSHTYLGFISKAVRDIVENKEYLFCSKKATMLYNFSKLDSPLNLYSL